MSQAHSQYPATIRETTVFADFQKPLIARTTRWEYVKQHIPLWKEAIRFRVYIALLAVVGIYFLFSVPAVSVLAAAGGAYFYALYNQRLQRLTSARKVIWGH